MAAAKTTLLIWTQISSIELWIWNQGF